MLVSLAEFTNAYWINEIAPRRQLLPGSVMHQALYSGQPATISLGSSKLHRADKALLLDEAMTSMLVIPVLVGDRIVAAVTLFSMEQRAFPPQIIRTAQAHVADWLTKLDTSFADISQSTLTALTERLLILEPTCRVSIQSWTQGSESTILLREIGFVDWISRNGPSLSINNYPTLRNVIEQQMVYRTTLQSLTPDDEEYQWLAARGAQAALLVPLLLHGDAIGWSC